MLDILPISSTTTGDLNKIAITATNNLSNPNQKASATEPAFSAWSEVDDELNDLNNIVE